MNTNTLTMPFLRAITVPLLAALFCGPAVPLAFAAERNKTTRAPVRKQAKAAATTKSTTSSLGPIVRGAPVVHSAAREWNEQLLAAIRINVPNPPAHARNLHHMSVAMYDAWAGYDTAAVGYIYNEKISPLPALPADIEAARREAISYAAYRVLLARFFTSTPTAPSSITTHNNIRSEMSALGYDPDVADGLQTGTPTAEFGKRVGQAILAWGATDGFSQTTYPQAYNAAVNPNMLTIQDPNNPPPAVIFPRAMSVLGDNGEPVETEPLGRKHNMPLGVGFPLIANTAQAYTHDADPNYWEPLALSASVTQNGIPTPGGVQAFVGVQSLATTPFTLTRTDPVKPWLDPGPPSRLTMPNLPASPTDAGYKIAAMDVLEKSAKLNDDTIIDISPGAFGNNPLGTDSGTGYALNPVTGLPYAANPVKRGDFARVIAEFWSDGPNSETPPGHWHVLANEVADDPLTVKRIGGVGPIVNDLEWDVKTYFALAGAVHDAACTVWALKRYYSGPRPITMIRFMGTMGQSTDIGGPSYSPQGLPLEPGVVEVITDASSADDTQRHWLIWDVYTNDFVFGQFHVGEVVVYSFPGEGRTNPPAQLPPQVATTQNKVCWMFAKDWLPFQRKTFNTPAFPGYASGHSCFSRSAAEVLTLITGSPSFPGGFHHHTVPANTMQIDLGPSADVDLQWNTYYDGADQAGQSRRWGGIHPFEDDYTARILGSQVGVAAYGLAAKYWTGAIIQEQMYPQVTTLANGNVKVTWSAIRGMKHKVQTSPDLVNWTDATSYSVSYTNRAIPGDTSGTYTDASPGTGQKFYRVVRTTAP
jgi:hypothetical protein